MEIVFIVFGWLLGILSPGIINRISDNYKKNTLQKIIISELRDLKNRFAWIPFTIKSDYGIVDENLIIWMKKEIEESEKFEENKPFTEAYKKMNYENKGDLTNFLKLCNTTNIKENPAFHFKKMLTSTIDSNLLNFGILDNIFLKKLLEVKFQINAFNEEIECIYDLLKMTFNSNITENNHQIIKSEIKRKNLLIAKKAIYIVEKINNVINDKK